MSRETNFSLPVDRTVFFRGRCNIFVLLGMFIFMPSAATFRGFYNKMIFFAASRNIWCCRTLTSRGKRIVSKHVLSFPNLIPVLLSNTSLHYYPALQKNSPVPICTKEQS